MNWEEIGNLITKYGITLACFKYYETDGTTNIYWYADWHGKDIICPWCEHSTRDEVKSHDIFDDEKHRNPLEVVTTLVSKLKELGKI